MTTETGPILEVRDVHVTYGQTRALGGVSLSVADGEFVAVIGPSGGGKSTLLRVLAGLEQPARGRVLYRGNKLTPDSAGAREIVMLWQSLALFPFMDVGENVEFGLKVRGVPRTERDRRVGETLKKVGLADYGRRKIHELSGGEQQRVALARALVVRPRVVLLDEPFGALDVHLRAGLAWEFGEVHRGTGMTFVMVTHDHGEALAMGSRVAVLNRGRLEQVGTPEDIRIRPATEFVSRFVGNRNVHAGILTYRDPCELRVRTPAGEFSARPTPWTDADIRPGQAVVYVVDACHVTIGEAGGNQLEGTVEGSSFLGSLEVVRVAVPELGTVSCEVYHPERGSGSANRGRVRVSWRTEHAFVLPAAAQTSAEPS